MTARVIDRRIIGQEGQLVFALRANDVAGHCQTKAFGALHDRQGRPIVTLEKLDSRLESDPFHAPLLGRGTPKRKEAGSAKARLKFRHATGQVKRGTCWT